MWQLVLEAVGVAPVRRAFPATALCPGCGGILSIDLDFAHRGVWVYCDQCEAQGNSVEFAAHMWHCETAHARSRLGEMLPAAAAAWLDRQHLDSTLRRQTLQLFDDEPTRKLLYDDGLLRAALTRRGLDLQGPGIISNLSHLVYACEPKTLRDAVVERPSNKDRKRVSVCHGNLAMLPVWDRPGRAVGALAIRTSTDEEVFYRMKPASNAGGLMFAHLMPPRDPDLWIYVIAKIDDPWTVARLHLIERRLWGGTRLPLAAISTVTASPARGFRWEGRPLILWSDQPDVAAIALAERLGAKLAIVRYLPDQLTTPKNWLRQVEKAARDWRQVLQELILTCPPETVADVVQQLHLYTEDARRITRDWELSARERLLRATRNAIRCGECLYEEHGVKLLRSRGDIVEIVFHHLIRIDQVVRAPNGLHYLGRLSHGGGDLTFAEPAERFNRNADWMQDYLLKAGVVPDDIPPRKWREVSQVVKRLAPPVFKDGAKTMGWEAKLGVFVFNADFRGGEID